MCLARSTPHTGSSGAQGLWSEYTAKPQASRSQRDTGPLMPRDYGCCGTEKPAKRGEVESPLRLGQRPNECDALANRASCEAHPVAHVNTRQGLPLDRAWSLMPRDYGCCGTEKPAKRGEVESPLRLGQRPNECDALANRASCEAHPVAHVNTRQGLPLDRAWSLMPRDYGCYDRDCPHCGAIFCIYI